MRTTYNYLNLGEWIKPKNATMEEAKYYQPDISEFHVGFIFEVNKSTGIIPNQEADWQQTEFCESDNPASIKRYIGNNQFRVKHLDRSDIESEGWYPCSVIDGYNDTEQDNFVDGFEFSDYVLHKISDGRYFIYKREQYHETNKITGNWQQRTLFCGTIKNKSEFCRLLKQLNIK